MEAIDEKLDLTVPAVNQALRMQIANANAFCHVIIKPIRPTRSTRANSYYWAAIVTPFFQFLKEQEVEITHVEQAHIELKRNILGTRAKQVGKVMTRIVPDTHTMDTAEFMDYVERARIWLWNSVGLQTLDPNEMGVKPPRRQA